MPTEDTTPRALTEAEMADCKYMCRYCDEGWPVGKYGCHYEPVNSLDEPGMQVHCAAWRIRRIEFHGEFRR